MKTILAIICITALVGYALSRGIDGALFGIGITAVAGLGGYSVGRSQNLRNGGSDKTTKDKPQQGT